MLRDVESDARDDMDATSTMETRYNRVRLCNESEREGHSRVVWGHFSLTMLGRERARSLLQG